MNYFVTAIGTDSGKTVVSAILTEALHADYWKPIQAGLPKDSEVVRRLISNGESLILPEQYLLNTPASPHYAAKMDSVHLKVSSFELPIHSADNLIIEGAGGVMVPINEEEFVIDIATHLNTPLILVCNLYLGSINHSILTINEIHRRGLSIRGIIFNGDSNAASEQIILKHALVPELLHIYPETNISQSVIKKYAEVLKRNL